MTDKATIAVPVLGQSSSTGGGHIAVSIPRPPWGDLDIDDRSSTAPRGKPIMGDRGWRDDKVIGWADTIGKREGRVHSRFREP